MKFSELIDHAIECIKAFNPVIKTIDSHADSYLEKVSEWPFSQLKEEISTVNCDFYNATHFFTSQNFALFHSIESINKILTLFCCFSSKTLMNVSSLSRFSTDAFAMRTSLR